MLETIPEAEWNKDHIKNTIWSFVEATGKGEVLWPMRLALSGLERSPDPFELSEILGKEKTLARLRKVIS
jgi:glutamyl/glutaminyl-tRNA synthetase